MWVSEAPGGIQQVFAFHLCLFRVQAAGVLRADSRRVIQSRCGFSAWGKIWRWPWVRSGGVSWEPTRGAGSRSPGTRSRTRSGGVLIPHVSRGWLVPPGETPRAAGAAGDGAGPGLGTLLGIVALASAPWSGARLDCAVFRPSAAGCAVRGSLGFQQLSFGDKGLFSQLPSYRCSVRDNNHSRGVGGSPLALS